MKVFVLFYHHRHGDIIQVYKNLTAAQAARTNISNLRGISDQEIDIFIKEMLEEPATEF